MSARHVHSHTSKEILSSRVSLHDHSSCCDPSATVGTQLCYASNREQQDSDRDRIFAWNVNHHYRQIDLAS